MSNNKEFESIDELFRKTFNDLPESPASSGWDVPSDRVWQTVQTGIQTRHVGWSMTRKMIALAAISVVVATGVFLAMNTNNTTQQAPAPQPTILEQPQQQQNSTATTISSVAATPEQPVTSVANHASRVSNTRVTAPKASVNSMEKSATPTLKAVAAIPELPTPTVVEATPAVETPIENTSKIDKGRITAPKPPNSVEKRRLIEQMKAAWGTPLQTIPYVKGYSAPQIPAQVRNMRTTQPTTPGEE
jgi:hypothetical protein